MILKRSFDIFFSLLGLMLLSPLLLVCMFLVWKQDRYSPFYIAERVGLNGKIFKMIKLRSMIKNADKSGVDSTSADDTRITKVGHFIRQYKIDEISQLFNVLKGDMTIVGPRPNVKRETDLYTTEEKELLTVRPGITDFASIVFSDEGEILKPYDDPDIAYNQLIRPWKSKLGLFYIENRTICLDIQLIFLTALAIVSKERALQGVESLLKKRVTDSELVRVSTRKDKLVPTPPPGSLEIVVQR